MGQKYIFRIRPKIFQFQFYSFPLPGRSLKNYIPKNDKILLIHNGGLQGVAGMNLQLKNKKLQTIQFDD